MNWKVITKTALAVALSTALLLGCSSKDNVKENGQKTLILATSADYKPYEYTETENGKVIGFDIDLANMIAKELKLKIEVKDMDFNGLIPALQSNRADFIMAGMTPTPERKKSVDFSDIYYESKNTIISKKDSNFTSAKSLSGKKVGVQLGSIQEKEAQKLKLSFVSINKVPEMIQELKAGRIEAAIVENTIAEGYIANNPDLTFADLPNSEPTGSAVAFPKDSPYVKDFNRVLKQLKDNGKLDKLVKKWFQK